VLDLGCASGALGAALKARQGCAVVGVEVDPLYAARARERLVLGYLRGRSAAAPAAA
jgi:tRNA1(Val) A37 N6-methylase TrmN6